MNLQKLSTHFTSAGLALIVLLAYQNCSQTHFSSDLDGAVLKAEAIPSDLHNAGDDGQVPGGEQPAVSPTPNPSPSMTPPGEAPPSSPTPAPSASPGVDDKKGPKNPDTPDQPQVPDQPSTPDQPGKPNQPGQPDQPGKPEEPGSPQGKGKDKPDTSNLVECQLLHPNMKVVLNYEFMGQHGNSSAVRVCMSENACLKLINAFAVQHSCTVDASIPGSAADAQRQCTEIFPGSKGTCHNAAVLTDAEVTKLLEKMSQK